MSIPNSLSSSLDILSNALPSFPFKEFDIKLFTYPVSGTMFDTFQTFLPSGPISGLIWDASTWNNLDCFLSDMFNPFSAKRFFIACISESSPVIPLFGNLFIASAINCGREVTPDFLVLALSPVDPMPSFSWIWLKLNEPAELLSFKTLAIFDTGIFDLLYLPLGSV